MCDQVLALSKRKLVNYLFPMVISLLEEIDRIINALNSRTYNDRIVVIEETRKGKTVRVHSVTPLTKQQISNELNNHNLSMVIYYIKEGLNQINHQTLGIDEMFEWLEKAHIDNYYFKQCCKNCSDEDLDVYLIDILGAMRISLGLGHGNPEIYNNIFSFLAFHTLNFFDFLEV